MITIAVDAMGGDNAPQCNVNGAVLAVNENQNINVILVGQEEVIKKELEGKSYDASRLTIRHTSEVIETGEVPARAIQKKKDSSMVVGLKMLKNGEADGFVSCGSTGALLVGGQTIAGRVKGVRRAPLAVVIPTQKRNALLIDCGANVDAKPEILQQFAVMGSLYAQYVMGISNPQVGLVNIGTEEEKGNALTRETYPILQKTPGINFMGNAEARDIFAGVADVYVCEAFVGNVVLKMYEGVGRGLLKEIKKALMSSLLGKIGGLLIKPSLKGLMKTYGGKEDGGAPLLGLSGLVVKAHGNSSDIQMKNAIIQCISFKENNLNDKIAAGIAALGEEN